jgi:CHAT domain-containing protein
MVSSYTPSLSTLLRVKSHQGPQSIPWSNVNSLLVSAPHVPDLPPLLKADEEVQHVVNLVRIHSNTSNGDLGGISTETLVKPVMDKLPSSHILHLACHGRQHKNPLESHFALTDGPLSIEALMGLNLPNAMLAFLSACDTAKGDRNQPDQAVHLAASLLFCGFKSVIGTMW